MTDDTWQRLERDLREYPFLVAAPARQEEIEAASRVSGAKTGNPMTDEEVQILVDRYLNLCPADPVPTATITEIESRLGIVLPRDLKIISTVYSGDILGRIPHNQFAASGPADNVVDKTLELRKTVELPRKYVVLTELCESLIVLETQDREEVPSPVIWLDSSAAEALVSGVPEDADVFPSYADYFASRVEVEESERSLH